MDVIFTVLKLIGIGILILIVGWLLGWYGAKLISRIVGEDRLFRWEDSIVGWFEDLGDLLGELPDGWRSRRQFRRRMVKHREETDRKNREILAERERERRERESASNAEALALKREGEAEE